MEPSSDLPSPAPPTPLRRRSRAQLVFGLALLALGALLLADNLGFPVSLQLWEAWPLVIVGLGALKLVFAEDSEERGSGLWTLVAGLYCWVSSWRLFGLHWGTAWPIFLVAQGIVIVFHGSFGSCRSRRRGVRDAD